MRSLAFASLILAALAGACSAVDNFDRFKFVDDGGAGDMSSAVPGFGQACTDTCQVINPTRPLMCVKMLNNVPVPGGMCTRQCVQGTLTSCNDYPDALCGHVEGMDVCLQRCDPSLGRNCRTGFSCCDNQHVVTVAGLCAPTQSDLCH